MTDGETELSFTYDVDGLRTKKQVDDTTWEYVYNGSMLIHMTDGSNTLHFRYGDTAPVSVNYNGTEYFYLKNVQGDITGLTDTSGNVVVEYTYDAWGNPLTTTGSLANTLGQTNPLRYRGYVYDTETGLYYLQSRYYDPEVGRFINADSAISGPGGDLLGYNMFAYCFNNPANAFDDNGNWPKWLETTAKITAVALVVVTAVVVVSVATAGTGGLALAAAGIAFGTACGALVGGLANERKGNSFINGALGGAVSGLVQSTGTATTGGIGTIVGGGVGSGLGTAITEKLNNKGKPKKQQKTSKEILDASLKSAALATSFSVLTAGVGYGVNFAQNSPIGYNAWAESLNSGIGIMPITPGFGEMMKGFFGVMDDGLVYLFSD